MTIQRPKRPRRQGRSRRECLSPGCRWITSRPFGYCDKCWNRARAAERPKGGEAGL